ncbi:MAG: DUF1461 domain-containing protein [Oleiphilaceae bacterium]|nr:DUF1461 domain-containing protein [Oleiphilaceae bacterium]
MTASVFPARLRAPLIWLGYGLACLWLALALAWWLCAHFDYAYPVWYEVFGIENHIEKYAPQNPQKRGFAQLSREQHLQAFAQINESVSHDGAGLEDIVYPGPQGQPVPLLNADEVNHLRDVAHLLDRTVPVTALFTLLWLPLAVALRRTGAPARPVRWLTVGTAALILAGLLVVLGPEKVFYTLHEWLFPPENPWFFYWEESLMSTLMKAPVLFGGIAVMIAAVALPLVVAFYWLGQRVAGAVTTRWASASTD